MQMTVSLDDLDNEGPFHVSFFLLAMRPMTLAVRHLTALYQSHLRGRFVQLAYAMSSKCHRCVG